MPTEPFMVWARPHAEAPGWQTLTISQKRLLFFGFVSP